MADGVLRAAVRVFARACRYGIAALLIGATAALAESGDRGSAVASGGADHRGRPVDPAPDDIRGDAERQSFLAQIETVGRRGFLYEVSKPPSANAPAQRLFLYGTIHLGRVGSEPFNRPVVTALRASRRLALEADPTDDAATRRLALQLGIYPDGDGLQRHLSPASMDRVRAFGTRSGIAAADLERIRPWLLANMVTLHDFGDLGLDPALGSELYLSGFARARRLPIVEIEGIEAQLRLLAGMPDAMQVAELEEALQDADGPANATEEPEGKALFDLWLDGDAQVGDALVAQMHRDAVDKPFGRYFVDTLIDRRDRTMADRAEQQLALPGSTFFAVGALHLFGPLGLVAEMRRRGYRVVDLQAPAPIP